MIQTGGGLVRLVLVAAGFILFAGGMLSLLSSEEIASGQGWQLNETGVWTTLLISIIPGILLVLAGIMLEQVKGRRIVDFAMLAVSIVVFFFLTMVVMYY
jgi:hypothetical protein